MIRLFVQVPLREGGDVPLEGDQSHYLIRVMRLGEGDEVRLFNGADGEWSARIVEAGKRGCRLRTEAMARPQSSAPDVELNVALVKRAPLETIVEKATELGVNCIRLLRTERTNPDHTNLERLAAIAREAAEQCGRLDVPQIHAAERLADRLAAWDGERALMFCDEAGDAQGAVAALLGKGPGPWAVLIGPEGGFTSAERSAIRSLAATTPVSLGPRILRADTAVIAALSVWQSVLGDGAGLEVGSALPQVRD
ncbi:MAG: 16S rRNA (uracil(1498)-N(3))-methyltransferase [Caulobacteraceae bacterium]|nr:16S rRNA (uracil(1498)-N(3))-methyltransferase [Caulobacteraceae bacterium]